jgi:DNA-binding LacI/PurR family transcriptional regulator
VEAVTNGSRPIDLAPSKRTIHEVARRAKVSITTVSRTINSPSLVDPATASRVWQAIQELNYYPNTHARSLVSGRSRILGLIVSDITNPFFPELVKRFEEAALERGYDILVSSTDYDSARGAHAIRRMLEHKVEGVSLMTSEMDESLVDQFARRRVPLVFLDVGTPGDRVTNIVVDYETGVNQAVDHLVSLGHRRIGFVSGPQELKSARIRLTAFIRALDQYGIKEADRVVVEGDHKVGGGFNAMTRILDRPDPPAAMLASNDLTAIGIMRAIHSAGLKVPANISVVGFDDIWLAQFTEPPLTTVRLPVQDIAEKSCHALLSSIDKKQHTVESVDYTVKTRLIIRESTCPA